MVVKNLINKCYEQLSQTGSHLVIFLPTFKLTFDLKSHMGQRGSQRNWKILHSSMGLNVDIVLRLKGNLYPMNLKRKKHSLKLYQQGINEPQDIKFNREQSILMSSKLMFTLNQFTWRGSTWCPAL